ncbi:hypothetical protein [Paenibacillus riograndensis]|uniref:HNH endonuclease n=1 Tax=Paenibacillus riograndensis SBR5 TaxID=1073571 RepID=A0A0E4H881_9BACL|nr:hypothetical protein [Paenibacillus riograndensis]CQR52614.1 hypothetical protein PRIO_0913 [Paenibacillus riograndensis SBR5]
MLFDLEKPYIIHSEMKLAGECMVALIKYCNTYGITDGQFDEKSFLKLRSHKMYKHCCLMKHPGAMRHRMKELFSTLPVTAIPFFISCLEEDLRFNLNHHQETYHFPGFLNTVFQGILTVDETKKAIDQLPKIFEKFYSDFFDHKESHTLKTNRDRFKDEYIRLNSSKENICPACLGQMHMGKAQLDHYFPKSLFPALVIHPFNIVPICMECNSSVGKKQDRGKGNRVPAWPEDGEAINEPGCLNGVFLPYIRSGQQKFKSRIDGTPGNRVIKVEPLSTAASDEAERIRRHVDTFNLEKAWTNRIPFHFNVLMQRTLSEFARVYTDRVAIGGTVTKEEVGDFLWNKLVLNTEDTLYEVGYQFEFVSYVISMATTPECFHPFYKELLKRMEIRTRKAMPTVPHIYDSFSTTC